MLMYFFSNIDFASCLKYVRQVLDMLGFGSEIPGTPGTDVASFLLSDFFFF